MDTISIKLDRSTLPEDQQEVRFEAEISGNEAIEHGDTLKWFKGSFVSGDDVFVTEDNRVFRAWDITEWVAEENWEELSPCCGAEILGESEICASCKEHV